MKSSLLGGALMSCVLALCLSGCGAMAPTGGGIDTGSGGGQSGGGGAIGDFSLKDVDGRTHSLSDYLGSHVVLISFWATWCEPCKKEMNQLEALFKEHGDSGLMVLSVSMDEPESQGDVRPFVKQRGFSYPVLLDTDTQVTNQFNPRRAAPYSLVIDRQEQISWTHEGYVPGDEKKLEAAVLAALGSSSE
jgi:peroxiredoxin